MTKPAAIALQLVDIRNIGMHKCVKLTLHAPAEQAPEIMAAFGWPTATDPVPVALARLQLREPRGGGATADKETEEPITEKPEPEAAPLVRATRLIQQAGICCKDPRFWAFLRANDMACTNFGDAEIAVRFMCHVKSRKEFIPSTAAGDRWDRLYSLFIAWRDVPDAA